jgi:hypothetical protein
MKSLNAALIEFTITVIDNAQLFTNQFNEDTVFELCFLNDVCFSVRNTKTNEGLEVADIVKKQCEYLKGEDDDTFLTKETIFGTLCEENYLNFKLTCLHDSGDSHFYYDHIKNVFYEWLCDGTNDTYEYSVSEFYALYKIANVAKSNFLNISNSVLNISTLFPLHLNNLAGKSLYLIFDLIDVYLMVMYEPEKSLHDLPEYTFIPHLIGFNGFVSYSLSIEERIFLLSKAGSIEYSDLLINDLSKVRKLIEYMDRLIDANLFLEDTLF